MKKYLLILAILVFSTFLFSQDPDVLFNQAENKMKTGELEQADSLLKESLKIDPSFAPAHIGFSELWLRKGDLVKANESATKAVQMDEEFRSWWNGLNDIRARIQNGKRNVQQGQFDVAMQEY